MSRDIPQSTEEIKKEFAKVAKELERFFRLTDRMKKDRENDQK